ncbi:Unknown protein sequence [Pseudomonas syringae pv. cilantro]|uniref:Uncharacterized protein n=1 Tax=Pseudomonas syringae pv. cilantro TaxID=81035 RepID=A0A0N0X7L3_PSESX|nr:Unknown protein sequence [Pseudomonas syringae pv. cilantro]
MGDAPRHKSASRCGLKPASNHPQKSPVSVSSRGFLYYA